MSRHQFSSVKPAHSVPRVSTERWVFVGDDSDAFASQWLKAFAERHANNRIEGYVLDLTRGSLWAALDLSGVSQEVYDDIALLVVEPEDAKASKAFTRLTRNCDPNTAHNEITTAFDAQKWPKLAEACSGLARLGLRDIDAVGKWLKAEAARLEAARNRRVEFRSSIKRIIETYPERPTWNSDFMLQADKNHWPDWAVECFLEDPAHLDTLPDGRESMFVLDYMFACVSESHGSEIVSGLRNGQVLKVNVPVETARLLRQIADKFKQDRDHILELSGKADIGATIHTMTNMELLLKARSATTAFQRIRDARIRVSRRANLAFAGDYQ